MDLTIATRGSRLARWQADHVRARLEAAHPGLRVGTRLVRTTGDRVTDVPLSRIGDRGLFTREVDRVVLDLEADVAVHSLKDVPTLPEPGLVIAAVTQREDPRDVVVFRPGLEPRIDDLPPGARVGTSSLRRRAQLLARRPDLAVDDLRGNLDTRLERVATGGYDAAILAAAGILRLGRPDAIGEWLDPPGWLPAVGQGALGLVARDGDGRIRELLAALDHAPSRAATTAERAFLNELRGGCQVPIGALGEVDGDRLRLRGVVASLDGTTVLADDAAGPAASADDVGRDLARALRERGADRVLDAVRAHAPFPGASPP